MMPEVKAASAGEGPTIRVIMKFFGLTRKAGPGPEPERGVIVELAQGAKVTDLLKEFGLVMHRNIVTVQGRAAKWNTVLTDGQEVQVVGPPGGG